MVDNADASAFPKSTQEATERLRSAYEEYAALLNYPGSVDGEGLERRRAVFVTAIAAVAMTNIDALAKAAQEYIEGARANAQAAKDNADSQARNSASMKTSNKVIAWATALYVLVGAAQLAVSDRRTPGPPPPPAPATQITIPPDAIKVLVQLAPPEHPKKAAPKKQP